MPNPQRVTVRRAGEHRSEPVVFIRPPGDGRTPARWRLDGSFDEPAYACVRARSGHASSVPDDIIDHSVVLAPAAPAAPEPAADDPLAALMDELRAFERHAERALMARRREWVGKSLAGRLSGIIETVEALRRDEPVEEPRRLAKTPSVALATPHPLMLTASREWRNAIRGAMRVLRNTARVRHRVARKTLVGPELPPWRAGALGVPRPWFE